ncbi:hypothetical protein N9O56_02715 [Rickettsiales bacterium]|nr:hypothetical protein [Rickettsiales bacterium]
MKQILQFSFQEHNASSKKSNLIKSVVNPLVKNHKFGSDISQLKYYLHEDLEI